MRDDLDLKDGGGGLTIISDQQKGLENAVKELLLSLTDNTNNDMNESFNAWTINERHTFFCVCKLKLIPLLVYYLKTLFFCRYMLILTILQEKHFKLLTRMW